MGLRPIFEDYDSYFLEHDGTPHEADGTPHSGRYTWGSGEMPHQHPHYRTLYDQYNVLYSQYIKDGNTEKEADLYAQIALGLDNNGEASATVVKSLAAGARASAKTEKYYQIKELQSQGKGATAIAKELGMKKESSVRSLDKEFPEGKDAELLTLVEHLEAEVDKKGYIDVGQGTAEVLSQDKDTTQSRLQDAINLMKADGYYYGNNHTFKQMGTSKPTTMKIIGPKYEDHSAEGNKKQWLYAQKMVDAAKISPVRDFESMAIKKESEKEDSMYNTSGKLWPPVSLDSKRLYIRYEDDPEQSGVLKDGIIELRKGVADISLGDSVYSQVRIAVDGKYYLKGMAVYSDDIPEGYDVVFNSNKNSSKGLKALKDLNFKDKEKTIMTDNPFNSSILRNRGQYNYIDPETGEKKQSVINKVREEGDWNDWSRTLAHQFLSKQDTSLIKNQLEVTKLEKQLIYEDLQDVTNPVIRSKLMADFADECDSAAKYLKATALPGQTTRVLLPLNEQKEDEVYAPGYENGTKVALIRYPHQGVFEIPIKTVNNNTPAGKRNYGELFDAIGVNYNTRVQLSGADCDGDTAVVIPLNGVNVRNDKPIKELTDWIQTQDDRYGWDQDKYPVCPFKIMPKAKTGTEMGIITNLITDMQVKHGSQTDASRLGTANEDQFTRDLVNAIKYAYLVIDANKHKLDYQRAKKDLGIEELHKKYQGRSQGGAATILSRAKGQEWIPEESEYTKVNPDTGEKIKSVKYKYEYDENNRVKIDPETGEKVFALDENGNKIPATKKMYIWEKNEDGSYKRESKVDPDTGLLKSYKVHATDENGKWLYKEVLATQKTTKMDNAQDARQLMSGSKYNEETGEWTYSGTVVETLYANYANSMKTLANEARKASLDTNGYRHNAQAEGVYASEIASLEEKLRVARENSPRERQAQMAARTVYATALAESGYSLEESDRKKIRGQELDKQRARFGANKEPVQFSDREWEAIQNNACSKTLLESLMKNCKKEELASKAVEKSRDGNERRLTPNVIAWIKRMANNDSVSREDIADQLGISVSTVYGVLNGKIKAAS